MQPLELGKPLVPPCQVTRIRFSPDGKTLVAACTDGLVRRWNVTGKEPAELEPLKGHNGWVASLVHGKDVLLTADSWGRLTAWDANGKPQWSHETAHDGWVRMLASDPLAGSRLATCGKDGFVRLWNATARVSIFWSNSAILFPSLAFQSRTKPSLPQVASREPASG